MSLSWLSSTGIMHGRLLRLPPRLEAALSRRELPPQLNILSAPTSINVIARIAPLGFPLTSLSFDPFSKAVVISKRYAELRGRRRVALASWLPDVISGALLWGWCFQRNRSSFLSRLYHVNLDTQTKGEISPQGRHYYREAHVWGVKQGGRQATRKYNGECELRVIVSLR